MRARAGHPPSPMSSARVKVTGVAQRFLLLAALLLLVAPAAQAAVPKPTIVQKPIPFPQKRKNETAAYAKRHYGIDSYRLTNPNVIVEHVTVTSTISAVFNTFAPDRPVVELHELPDLCSHFVIDRDGTIYQLVPLGIMCRDRVALNYAAFGIEHVGMSDGDVIGNKRQMEAWLRLTRWLRCRYSIGVGNVI